MRFLCSRSIHRWKLSLERYIIPNDINKDKVTLQIRTCKKCGKRQVYTMIYALRNLKKYWKDWDKKDGDTIHWRDLD